MGDWVGPVGGSGSYKQGIDEGCKMPLPDSSQNREVVYVVSTTRADRARGLEGSFALSSG
jgi:hypothetical protein